MVRNAAPGWQRRKSAEELVDRQLLRRTSGTHGGRYRRSPLVVVADIDLGALVAIVHRQPHERRVVAHPPARQSDTFQRRLQGIGCSSGSQLVGAEQVEISVSAVNEALHHEGAAAGQGEALRLWQLEESSRYALLERGEAHRRRTGVPRTRSK